MLEFFQALRLEQIKVHAERELHSTAVYLGILKRLKKQRRNQAFSNSRMLPGMRNLRVHDEEGVAHWRDHKGAVTFDCCAIHRSRKQNLLKIAADSITFEPAVTYQSTASERALRKYQLSAQGEIRDRVRFGPTGADPQTAISRRTFRIGDYESLHYQLQLIERRLQGMLASKRMSQNFAFASDTMATEFVVPIDSGSESADNLEPVDLWYDLADSQATPPIMLRWLTEHSNPYISNRACKTLNVLSKAS